MKHVYIGSANMDWRSLSQVSSAIVFSNTLGKINVQAHNRKYPNDIKILTERDKQQRTP